jgi:hypothetical protein
VQFQQKANHEMSEVIALVQRMGLTIGFRQCRFKLAQNWWPEARMRAPALRFLIGLMNREYYWMELVALAGESRNNGGLRFVVRTAKPQGASVDEGSLFFLVQFRKRMNGFRVKTKSKATECQPRGGESIDEFETFVGSMSRIGARRSRSCDNETDSSIPKSIAE